MVGPHGNIQSLMKVELQIPSFSQATDWLNLARPNATNYERNEALKRETKGRPTLVHFWSVNSESAKINLLNLGDWGDERKLDIEQVSAINSIRYVNEV